MKNKVYFFLQFVFIISCTFSSAQKCDIPKHCVGINLKKTNNCFQYLGTSSFPDNELFLNNVSSKSVKITLEMEILNKRNESSNNWEKYKTLTILMLPISEKSLGCESQNIVRPKDIVLTPYRIRYNIINVVNE